MDVGGGFPREVFLFALELDFDERSVLAELVPCGDLSERSAGLYVDGACVRKFPERGSDFVFAVRLEGDAGVERLARIQECAKPEFADGVEECGAP